MDSDQEEVRTVGMVPVALVCLQHTQQWKIEPADYSNKEEPPPRKTKKIRFRVALVSCHSDVKDHCCIHLTQTPYRQSQDIAESHGVEPLLPFNIIHYINHTLRKRRIKKNGAALFFCFFFLRFIIPVYL